MKTILVPLLDDDTDGAEELANAQIATAYLLAARFASHIEGLFVRPAVMAGTAPLDVAPQYIERHRAYWDSNAETSRSRFTEFIDAHKVPFREIAAVPDAPTAGWREVEGHRPLVVGSYGRLFDLIVVRRRSAGAIETWMDLCEAALFDSGRLVVIAPPEVPSSLGHSVVIAWNGSTETARTIGLGMPLIEGAETVTVLSVAGAGGGMVPGPTGEQVARHLARNGVKAVARTVQARKRPAGVAIIEEAAALGADILLKGAYSHSRLREIVFGGTTRHILNEARLPVLIAH